MSSFGTLVKHT